MCVCILIYWRRGKFTVILVPYMNCHFISVIFIHEITISKLLTLLSYVS